MEISGVPIRQDGTLKYVRLADIPKQHHDAFLQFMRGGQQPVIANEASCFWPQDWARFARQEGLR